MRELTILYAEDNKIIRDNYIFILGEYFHTVKTANDGREALEKYHECKPDALLLDVTMPYMTGLEVAAKVREVDENIPIVMFTAHSENEMLLQAVNLQLTAYLIKPVDFSTLNETLLKVIKQLQGTTVVEISANLIWNQDSNILYYKQDSITLSEEESILLKELNSEEQKNCLGESLMQAIWGENATTDSHGEKLNEIIYDINKKIASSTRYPAQLIENQYDDGYKLKIYS